MNKINKKFGILSKLTPEQILVKLDRHKIFMNQASRKKAHLKNKWKTAARGSNFRIKITSAI